MQDLSNENVIHVKKKGIEFLQFRKLLEFSDIINHAYSLGVDKDFRTESTLHKPISEGKINIAISSYKELSHAIGSDYKHVVKARQTHTKTVKCVDSKENPDGPDFYSDKYEGVDGLITNKSNIMLSTTNADCILLLFFDPVKKVIANVHSGWKGTIKRISVEAINKMQETYGSEAKDIICCICPSIRKCHFEVEEDVKDLFENEFRELKGFVYETIKNKKWHIDTVLINKEILKQAGLKKENIIDSGICSVCNSDCIHSYRVEKKGYGLSTALIEIKG